MPQMSVRDAHASDKQVVAVLFPLLIFLAGTATGFFFFFCLCSLLLLLPLLPKLPPDGDLPGEGFRGQRKEGDWDGGAQGQVYKGAPLGLDEEPPDPAHRSGHRPEDVPEGQGVG